MKYIILFYLILHLLPCAPYVNFSNDSYNDCNKTDSVLMQLLSSTIVSYYRQHCSLSLPVEHHVLTWHHLHCIYYSYTFKIETESMLTTPTSYQLVPCGSHGPRHTQQNSALHALLRHIM